MNATKTIWGTWGFGLAVGIPILFFVILAGAVYVNEACYLDLRLDSLGYKQFWKLYQFPFTVLATAIPLGGFAAYQHRSMQTAEQVRQQMEQNIRANYYSHKDDFVRHIERAEFKTEIWGPSLRIYRMLYPDTKEGIFLPRATFLKNWEQDSEKMQIEIYFDDEAETQRAIKKRKDSQKEAIGTLVRFHNQMIGLFQLPSTRIEESAFGHLAHDDDIDNTCEIAGRLADDVVLIASFDSDLSALGRYGFYAKMISIHRLLVATDAGRPPTTTGENS